jgi:hypothetical protein
LPGTDQFPVRSRPEVDETIEVRDKVRHAPFRWERHVCGDERVLILEDDRSFVYAYLDIVLATQSEQMQCTAFPDDTGCRANPAR